MTIGLSSQDIQAISTVVALALPFIIHGLTGIRARARERELTEKRVAVSYRDLNKP